LKNMNTQDMILVIDPPFNIGYKYKLIMTGFLRNLVNNKKVTYAALSALVFMAVSLPQTYQQTNRLPYMSTTVGTCPTPAGKFVHTGTFFVALYFLMKWLNRSNLSDGLIAKYSFYSALIFFALNANETYALTSRLPNLGPGTLDLSGCPTRQGVVLHTVIT
jgi:hypothetical protein